MGNKVLPFTRDRAGQAPTEDIRAAQIIAAMNRGRAGAERVIAAGAPFGELDETDRAYLLGMSARLREVAEA